MFVHKCSVKVIVYVGSPALLFCMARFYDVRNVRPVRHIPLVRVDDLRQLAILLLSGGGQDSSSDSRYCCYWNRLYQRRSVLILQSLLFSSRVPFLLQPFEGCWTQFPWFQPLLALSLPAAVLCLDHRTFIYPSRPHSK